MGKHCRSSLRYLGPLDGAVRGEHVTELVVGDGPGDIPDVELPRRHLRRRLEHCRGGGHPQRQPQAPGLRRGDCTEGEAGGDRDGGRSSTSAAEVEGRRGNQGRNGGRHWRGGKGERSEVREKSVIRCREWVWCFGDKPLRYRLLCLW
jgi:hypothetical protein